MNFDGDWRPDAGKTALWNLGFSDYAPTCVIDELVPLLALSYVADFHYDVETRYHHLTR